MLNRQEVPKIFKVDSFKVDKLKKTKNDIIVLGQNDIPVFRLDIIFPDAGRFDEVVPFLNHVTAELLLSGTSIKSMSSIQEYIDFHGCYTQTRKDLYKTIFTVYGMEKQFIKVIPNILSYYSQCVFPEKEWSILKNRKYQQWLTYQKKTSYQAMLLMNEFWFGNVHPLSLTLNKEILDQLNPILFRETIERKYQNIQLVLTGLKKNGIRNVKCLTDIYGQQIKPIQNILEQDYIVRKERQGVKRKKVENTAQSSIIGRILCPPKTSDKYMMFMVLNHLFGGFFGSRLMKNIREKKGYTYAIYSSIYHYRDHSYIEVFSDVKKGKESEIMDLIQHEFNSLITKGFSKKEFHMAVSHIQGMYVRYFSEFFSISDKIVSQNDVGLDLTWYEKSNHQLTLMIAELVHEEAYNYYKNKSFFFTWAG
jgi:zinc protease